MELSQIQISVLFLDRDLYDWSTHRDLLCKTASIEAKKEDKREYSRIDSQIKSLDIHMDERQEELLKSDKVKGFINRLERFDEFSNFYYFNSSHFFYKRGYPNFTGMKTYEFGGEESELVGYDTRMNAFIFRYLSTGQLFVERADDKNLRLLLNGQ